MIKKDLYIGKKCLFITHYPDGILKEVTILGENKFSSNKNAFYFAKKEGGTDTTTPEFLLDYPETMIKPSESDNEAIELLKGFGI